MPDPSNFLFLFASAIASGEGYFTSGSLPQRNNNPGDFRTAPWLQHPVIVDGFVHFGSREEGIAALYTQILIDTRRGLTPRQVIFKWAPPTDGNDSENYYKETCRRVGITYYPPDDAAKEPKMWSYLDVTRIP